MHKTLSVEKFDKKPLNSGGGGYGYSMYSEPSKSTYKNYQITQELLMYTVKHIIFLEPVSEGLI